MDQRIHGVIGLRKIEFYITGLELRIVGAEVPHHIVPMVIVEKAALFLVRVVGSNHQPQLLKVRILDQMIRQDKVAYVDGVEGPEKESDLLFHFSGFFAPTKSATKL